MQFEYFFIDTHELINWLTDWLANKSTWQKYLSCYHTNILLLEGLLSLSLIAKFSQLTNDWNKLMTDVSMIFHQEMLTCKTRICYWMLTLNPAEKKKSEIHSSSPKYRPAHLLTPLKSSLKLCFRYTLPSRPFSHTFSQSSLHMKGIKKKRLQILLDNITEAQL